MSSDVQSGPPWYRTALPVALAGSLLLWAALPPLAIGWLAWIAPVPWLVLVIRPELPGRRPYLALYVAGLAFWLAAIHWLRLPHPLVYFGWFALSAYLACYLPMFVGLSRVAVHRLGAPLWLAAPVVWTGLELARAHVMTGFLMASLAHTQVEWLAVIQIADVFGEYGADFLIVLVAACVARASLLVMVPRQGDRKTSRRPAVAGRQGDSSTSPISLSPPLLVSLSLLPAAVALAAALVYGRSRLSALAPPPDAKTVRIALIQGNSLADWKFDDAKQRQIMEEYVRLSHEAVANARSTGDGRPLDLVVWPETMFRVPLMSFDAAYKLPPGTKQTKQELASVGPRELGRLVAAIGAPVLVGIDRLHYQGSGVRSQIRRGEVQGSVSESDLNPEPRTLNPPTAYNSAVLVDREGQVVGTYDKFHLVMFGEYVPFSRWLPFLKQISSLTGSVDAGEGPVGLTLDGTTYVPNICYETVIPHVIRRHVTHLRNRSESPDVLVNMTNDAWYWGSSELEQHLASAVFRAIETRRPLVIAANGGISAWIDHTGRIRALSPKMRPDTIIADVEVIHADSPYRKFGDWFAGGCLTACIVLAIVGLKSRPSPDTTRKPGDKS